MNQFWKAIGQSVRTLLKRPAFLTISVLTLALGICFGELGRGREVALPV